MVNMTINDKSTSFMNWRLSLAETISAIFAVVIITIWFLNTFQSKNDASTDKNAIDVRVGKVETEMGNMRTSMEVIGRDTSYIRGRLEPKNER